MPTLERFFDPQMRKFDANVRPLPGARLYFFDNNTTTPKLVYQDKQGSLAHTNPVIADSTGVFPQIFLDGLYSVELRSNKNIVQPGWPINNIGQDTPVVPFGPWNEINTYNTGEVVTAPNGNWYRSITDGNLGNDPISSPSEWEVIPIPVASSFTSNKDYLTWADDGDQVSLNVDTAGLVEEIEANITGADGDFEVRQNLSVVGNLSLEGNFSLETSPLQIGDGVGDTVYINNEGEISSDGTNYYGIATKQYDMPEITCILQGNFTQSVDYPLRAKVVQGVLHIYGQVTSGTPLSTNVISSLPAGYRPSSERVLVIGMREPGSPPAEEVSRAIIQTGGGINWINPVTDKIVYFSVSVPL